MRLSLLLSCAIILVSSPALSGQTLDTFESYVVAFGGAEVTGNAFIDDTTITTTGQGPNLVADGCTYTSPASSIQWNGDSYFGLTTNTILSNSQSLVLTYDSPTTDLSFTIQCYDGYGDVVTVNLYDSAGSLISSTPGINVPDSTPVPFSSSGPSVASVELISGSWSWSPIIDDHQYGSGLSYTIGGLVGGGTATLTVSGATAGGGVLIGYSLTGPGPTMTPFGLVDMSPPITSLPTLTANGSGVASMSTAVPGRASGYTVYSQAADLSTSALTNSVAQLVL